MPPSIRPIRTITILASLCALLAPTQTNADIVFEAIADDSFIGRSAG